MTFTSKLSLSAWPRRIICLTAETTEIVYLLGAGERIVGVSGYSVRPPEAREKPKVAAFTSIKIEKIRELNPDLILGFSDLQKQIAHDLIQEGFPVFITNQRSLSEIGDVLLAIGRLIGKPEKAEEIRENFFGELEKLAEGPGPDCCPRVYFEEWDEPLISGISWVSELIERLGGEDIFKEKSLGKTAKDRTVRTEDVIAKNPDMILASWCGKKVQIEKIKSRPGWDQIKAVKNNKIFEIKSADILQPGPSLLHGARKISKFFRDFKSLSPRELVDGF
ncbi:MAG: cobalamin-binding protein [Candidatus Omnitrophica bacterium]|nr:cobalamin-binding protein [Candidatus Omnitrophota bacterium]